MQITLSNSIFKIINITFSYTQSGEQNRNNLFFCVNEESRDKGMI